MRLAEPIHLSMFPVGQRITIFVNDSSATQGHGG